MILLPPNKIDYFRLAFSMQFSNNDAFIGQKQHLLKDAKRIQNSKEDYILGRFKVKENKSLIENTCDKEKDLDF